MSAHRLDVDALTELTAGRRHLYHGSPRTALTVIEPRRGTRPASRPDVPVVYASPDPAYAACFLAASDDSWLEIGRTVCDGEADPWRVVLLDRSRARDLERPCALYRLPADGFAPAVDSNPEWVSAGAAVPVGRVVCRSAVALMRALGVVVVMGGGQ